MSSSLTSVADSTPRFRSRLKSKSRSDLGGNVQIYFYAKFQPPSLKNVGVVAVLMFFKKSDGHTDMQLYIYRLFHFTFY